MNATEHSPMAASAEAGGSSALAHHTWPKVLKHLLLFAAGLGLTLGTGAMLKDSHRQERRELELQGRARRTAEIAALWNRLPYVPFSTEARSRLLAACDRPEFGFSAPQAARLRDRLAEILAWLGEPVSTKFHPQPANGPAPAPGANPRRTTSDNATPPASSAGGGLDARAPGGLALASRLTAVCPEHIRAAITTTNTPGEVFNGPVAQGFTVACEISNPCHAHAPPAAANGKPVTPEGERPAGTRATFPASDMNTRAPPGGPAEPGLFFLLSFVARSDASTNAGPVYLCLCWSEADQDWALHRLISDALLNLRRL